jgi:beta-mannosidase
MGTLVWQLNDCWPVASWSITDYYNRQPKAAWYATREAYRDDIIPEIDLTHPIDMKLENPAISWKINGNKIVLKALKAAKYVNITIKGYKGKLSDNYFDVAAGQEKTITYEGGISKAFITVMSLYDVLNRNE